ncbi:hypothetical protein KIN20_029834 [Parelaphostrongylus tenuis]|uniref:Uncharacterized protein n=1 Tax=Parelaphostrongylus tenuis TaxID=148309 RepID=A0AAD5WFR3_PARTN|nr:hypothetical protein KIN20_029834 [Parelaphostrongylus tenuis]
MEDYGIKGDSPNHARGYMEAIRRRKGPPIDDVRGVSRKAKKSEQQQIDGYRAKKAKDAPKFIYPLYGGKLQLYCVHSHMEKE